MRTTLEIEDDILQTARELAANRGITIGKVISDLARQSLDSPRARKVRNGLLLLPRPPRGTPKLTRELVNRLRDEE